MDIQTHGRYNYVPIVDRKDYSWPKGARLAIYIAINLEHFSFGEGIKILIIIIDGLKVLERN
jgi:hypothetical protein